MISLKKNLLIEYKGKDLTEIIAGEIIETENSKCYHIETQDRITFKTVSSKSAKEKIISNLRLINGIGYSTELLLKKRGYRTIADLTNHPRFGPEASCFIDIIERSDIYQIIHWIEKCFSKSHPLILYSSGLQHKENFIIIDIGVVVGKSRTDVTRTFCIKPSVKKKKLIKLIKNAQKLAEKKIKPGIRASEVDSVVRKYLKKNSKMRFPYSLGHGVKSRIHQRPKIKPRSKDKIRIGDIFTLEPGLHSKTTGLRIEDMYLLTDKGLKKVRTVLIVPAPCSHLHTILGSSQIIRLSCIPGRIVVILAVSEGG